MASRAQWKLGIFAVGLQMAIKLGRAHSAMTHYCYYYDLQMADVSECSVYEILKQSTFVVNVNKGCFIKQK